MKFEMLGVSTSLLAANSLDLYHTTLDRRTTKRGGGPWPNLILLAAPGIYRG